MALKKGRTLWIILIGAVVILIAIAVVFKGSKGSGVEVKTEIAQKRTIVEKVSASGKIYPEVEVSIIPEISGEIIELYVEEGDSVKKGEPLVKINPNIYQDALERARAAVNTAQANLGNARARAAQAAAQLEKSKLEYNRSKRLFEDKVISKSEFEAAETNYNIAKAELDAAKEAVNAAIYNVKSAEATLKEMQNNLGKTTVYAPMTGIVSSLNVEEGKVVVGVAQMAVTEMMRIANLDEMEARVDVSENDILRINLGDTAEIEVEAYSDRVFKGVVTQISSSANNQLAVNTEQATNFTVKIRLLRASYADLMDVQTKKFPFLPGMSANVEIITERKSDVLSVPIEAVTVRTGDENKEEDNDEDSEAGVLARQTDEDLREFIFLYKDGKAQRQEVETGIQDDKYIVIKKGIEEGAEVIYAPYTIVHRTLRDGQSVDKEAAKTTAKKE